jgi:murein DD-endopeptidase MepM/ murein hydrolase activator NlpD
MADMQVVLQIIGQGGVPDNIHATARALDTMGDKAESAQSPLKRLGENLSVFGLAMGGIRELGNVVGGLAQSFLAPAQEMEMARARLNAFTKDADKTEEILKAVRSEADKTPFSFGEMASAAGSLAPIAARSGASLESLLQSAEALSASDPMQGFEGAVVALREAAGGSLTSLRERFEVDTRGIEEAMKAGVPPAQALSEGLAKVGINMDLVRNMAITSQGRLSTFNDTLEGIRRTAGEAILKGFSTGLDTVSTIIQDMLPELTSLAEALGVGIAAAMQLATAGFAAFAPILKDVISDLAANAPAAIAATRDAVQKVGEAVNILAVVFKSAWDAIQPVRDLIAENLRPILFGLAVVLTTVVVPAVVLWAAATATAAAATVVALAPVAIPLIALGAAAALLYKAWDSNFGGIQDKTAAVVGFLTQTAWPAIQNVFTFIGGAATAVQTTMAGVWSAIQTAIDYVTTVVLPTFQAAWAAVWAATGTILTDVWNLLLNTVFAPWRVVFETLTTSTLPALGEGFRLVTAAIGAAWTLVWDTILAPGLGTLQTVWQNTQDAVSTKATEVWDAITKKIGDSWKAIWTDGLEKSLATALGVWREKWDGVSTKIVEVWDAITKKIAESWKALWDDGLVKNLSTLETNWTQTWNNVLTIISGVWTTIVSKLDEWFGDVIRKLGDLANSAFEAAKDIGKKIMDGAKDGVTGAVDSLIGSVRDASNRAIDAAKSAIANLHKAPAAAAAARGGANGADAPAPPVEDAGAWVSPVRGVVTQEFGKTPYSSIYPGGIHTGIDVGNRIGTAVVAARSGRVDIAGWDTTGYGNLVAITHGSGLRTLYGHLSAIDVRSGQSVLSGQKIGEMGSTGNSSGSHLHFEVRESGTPTNPRRFTGFATGGVIPGPIGAGIPVMAHGGEVVLRPDQAEAMGIGLRRGFGGSGGMSEEQMRRMAGHIAGAVASAMAGMVVQIAGSGFQDAVVGAMVDSVRRGRLANEVNAAYQR